MPEPSANDPDAQRISDQSPWGGDRLSQENAPLSKRRRVFTGQMNPSDLIPTQEFVSSSRVENLRHAIRSATGIHTPVDVELTHETGSEGKPKTFVGHGHHRRQAAFLEGTKVPVIGKASHGYNKPAGTQWLNDYSHVDGWNRFE